MELSPRRRAITATALAAVGFLAACVAAGAETRTWTDDLSRSWDGEFLRVDGPSAVFLVGGKESSFPLARLSAADKVFIFKVRHAPANAAEAAPAGQGNAAASRPGAADLADAIFDAYNAAFLVRAKGETFYKKSLADDKRCGTWVGALEIQLAEDAYERTRSGAHAQLVRDLTATFLNEEGTHWSGDKWNDDLEWMMIACIRGYRITGNAALLNTTVSAWNMVYDRGWDTAFEGGIWENMDNVPAGGKCSLSNWPMIIAGADIYQSTHDAAVLAKCRAIYAWGRAHLFDPQTGRVYEQFGLKGRTGDDNVYNGGSFLSAANALHKITGESGYYDDALLAANHVVNVQPILHHRARGENAWGDQFVRALAAFCRDNDLWDRYRPWFTANADAAWKARRPDKNVTWNDWRTPTALDDCTSFECLSMAVLYQVMDSRPADPGARPPSAAAAFVR